MARKSIVNSVMKCLLRIFIVGLIPPTLALADREPMPPITPSTMTGIWEAIYTKNSSVRLFRMEIREGGPSQLAIGLVGEVSYVAKLAGTQVNNGTIRLSFIDDVMGPVEVSGSGRALMNNANSPCACAPNSITGAMEVALIMGTKGDSSRWELTFIRYAQSSLAQELQHMERTAGEAIKTGKGSYNKK